MQQRLNRREWAAVLAAALPARSAQVNAPAQSSAGPKPEEDKAADDVRSNSKRLAAVEIPMNVEPAFVFKP